MTGALPVKPLKISVARTINCCDLLKDNCLYSVILYRMSNYNYRQYGDIAHPLCLSYDLKFYYETSI